MLYMLDTNIVSYILEGNENIRQRLFAVLQGNSVVIPKIVYYEVQRGLFYNESKRKQKLFDAFCEVFGIKFMTLNSLQISAQIYSDLRKSGKLIEDDDIFIGSLALENDAILVTNNEKHLSRINGLKIENWSTGDIA